MRCDEIQERFVELLYNERGTPPASAELEAHVKSCPVCQRELEELKAVQGTLRTWKDEPPLRSVAGTIPGRRPISMPVRPVARRVVKFAAIAAMLVLAFLALANAEIKWSRDGFAFRTRLLPSPTVNPDGSNYYTKAEVREILRQVVDDSEARMTEGNMLMMHRMLEMVERDMDMQLIRARVAHNRN